MSTHGPIPRSRRILAAWAAMLVIVTGAGCVTERSTPVGSRTGQRVGPSTPTPRNQGAPATATRRPSAPPDRTAADVPLPTGPIARPASEATMVNSAVRAAIKPIGSVPFDGQVLPLISPDGRFLATQVGEAPTWPTLLATPGASAPIRTRLEVYDLTGQAPRRTSLAGRVPPGAMLGRNATTTEFLIEAPQPDGSRWIGAVEFMTGKLRWLFQGDAVNAHAVALNASGPIRAITFTQRRIAPDARPVLMLLNAGNVREIGVAEDSDLAELFPMLPVTGAGPLFSFELSSHGLEIVARSMDQSATIGAVLSRRMLVQSADVEPLAAYQAATPVQPWPIVPGAGETHPPGVLIFHPGLGRMAMIHAASGQVLPLAPKSISAAWAPDEGGWAVLLATDEGLVHQRLVESREGYGWESRPPAKMLVDPFVPRATSDPQRPFILLGPASAKDGPRLNIVLMQVVPDEAPAPLSAPASRRSR